MKELIVYHPAYLCLGYTCQSFSDDPESFTIIFSNSEGELNYQICASHQLDQVSFENLIMACGFEIICEL